MITQLRKIGNVADVIAGSMGFPVVMLQPMTQLAEHVDRFKNGDTVGPSAAKIVDFTGTWFLEEAVHRGGHIAGMDLIAHLFAFIAVDRIFLSGNRAMADISEIAVQFDSRVLRSGQAASPKNTYRHLEISSEFLAQDIRRDLGCPKKRVRGLVDGHGFIDAVQPICEVPSRFQLDERQVIGTVAIHLVGAGETEGRILAEIPRRHQEIERAYGIYVEVVVRYASGPVVRWLSGSVNDEVGAFQFEQIPDSLPITNVRFGVPESGKLLNQPLRVQPRRAVGAKKLATHVVVDADDFPSALSEIAGAPGADETA